MRVTVIATNGDGVIVENAKGARFISHGGKLKPYDYPVEAAITKWNFEPVDGITGDDSDLDDLISRARKAAFS